MLVGVLGSPALDERGLNGGPVAGAGGVLAQSINDGTAPIVNGRSPVERPSHGVVAVGNVLVGSREEHVLRGLGVLERAGAVIVFIVSKSCMNKAVKSPCKRFPAASLS